MKQIAHTRLCMQKTHTRHTAWLQCKQSILYWPGNIWQVYDRSCHISTSFLAARLLARLVSQSCWCNASISRSESSSKSPISGTGADIAEQSRCSWWDWRDFMCYSNTVHCEFEENNQHTNMIAIMMWIGDVYDRNYPSQHPIATNAQNTPREEERGFF